MPEMKTSTKRPRAVTIIAWFFIVYTLFSVIPKIYLIINSDAYKMALHLNEALSNGGFIYVPFSFQLAHALAGAPVILFSGIFMLKGRLWALAVFLLWIYGALVLTFLVSGLSISMYAKLIVAGIVTVIMTRPKPLA